MPARPTCLLPPRGRHFPDRKTNARHDPRIPPPLPHHPPRRLVRRAVISLLLIAVVSGLVFNAFTLLIPKLLQARLAADPALLPVIGVAAFLVTLCGALTQFTVGRLIDRHTLKRVFLPLSLVLAPTRLALSVLQGVAMLPAAGLAAAAPLVGILPDRKEELHLELWQPEGRAKGMAVAAE